MGELRHSKDKNGQPVTGKSPMPEAGDCLGHSDLWPAVRHGQALTVGGF